MDKLTILKALFAGLFFGAWPLLMNRSGLSGNNATFVFALFTFLVIAPLTIKDVDQNIFNFWAISATIAAAIGLRIFTSGLDKISKEEVSNFFVLTLVTQVCVSAIYQITLNGMTPSRALGFLAAIIAAILLR